jgi:hypothetical protein
MWAGARCRSSALDDATGADGTTELGERGASSGYYRTDIATDIVKCAIMLQAGRCIEAGRWHRVEACDKGQSPRPRKGDSGAPPLLRCGWVAGLA